MWRAVWVFENVFRGLLHAFLFRTSRMPRESRRAHALEQQDQQLAAAAQSFGARRSPNTGHAGHVTFLPLPVRLSQTAKPISFMPSSKPSRQCSSASASLPGSRFAFLQGHPQGPVVASRIS
jgi:hypothetical protein